VYGTVRTVVWEDGGSDPASYPILEAIIANSRRSFLRQDDVIKAFDQESESPKDDKVSR
jgi:hypothetical protein